MIFSPEWRLYFLLLLFLKFCRTGINIFCVWSNLHTEGLRKGRRTPPPRFEALVDVQQETAQGSEVVHMTGHIQTSLVDFWDS